MRPQLLIVEDNPEVRTMLEIMLKLNDYEVITAEDGLVALQLLETKHFDLILLDLMMPNMDGLTFVRELERRGLRSSLAILVLTADYRTKHLADQLHVDGIIVKPFKLSTMLKQVKSVLAQTRGDIKEPENPFLSRPTLNYQGEEGISFFAPSASSTARARAG